MKGRTEDGTDGFIRFPLVKPQTSISVENGNSIACRKIHPVCLETCQIATPPPPLPCLTIRIYRPSHSHAHNCQRMAAGEAGMVGGGEKTSTSPPPPPRPPSPRQRRHPPPDPRRKIPSMALQHILHPSLLPPHPFPFPFPLPPLSLPFLTLLPIPPLPTNRTSDKIPKPLTRFFIVILVEDGMGVGDEDEGVLLVPFGEVVGVCVVDCGEWGGGGGDEEGDAAGGEAGVECVCFFWRGGLDRGGWGRMGVEVGA